MPMNILLQPKPYENALLYLGISLFVLLCLILVYYVFKKEEIKKLLFFFPIPIIMMAFPSITELVINSEGLSIKRKMENVIENPDDPAPKQELAKAIQKAEKEAKTTKEIKTVVEANLILGNNKKVVELADKILNDEGAPDNDHSSMDIAEILEIKDIAQTSQEIQQEQRTISDTTILHEKIKSMKWQSPKTKRYLNNKVDLIRR